MVGFCDFVLIFGIWRWRKGDTLGDLFAVGGGIEPLLGYTYVESIELASRGCCEFA